MADLPGDATAAGSDDAGIASAASRIQALLAGAGDRKAEDEGTDNPQPLATDEGASEEAAQEAEPEKSEQSEEAETAKQQPKYRVKVEADEREVTLDELIKGYQTYEDYTRKTMKLGEERKAFEAQRQAELQRISQSRDTYGNYLAAIQGELTKPIYDAKEMEALRTGDINQRAEWSARMAEEADRKQKLQTVVDEQKRVAQQKQDEDAQAHQKRQGEARQKLMESIPEWKDQAVRKADQERMWNYGLSLGFAPEELAGHADHRLMLVLRDASAYRALQEKKPEVEKKVEAVKTVQPGASTGQPTRQTQLARASDRHQKEQSVHSAAELIRRQLGQGART